MSVEMKYRLYLVAFSAMARLPFAVLYLLSDLLYGVVYRVMRYRIGTVRGNLRASFPEATKRELRAIERKFYRQLCDNIVETAKLLHVSDAEVDRRIEVRGSELVDRYAAEQRCVILYLGHYGNWEWATAITRHFSVPIVCGQIYKPLRDKAFDRLMLKIRSRFDTISIPQKRAIRTLLGMKRDGKTFIMGFIADHRANGRQAHHWTEFLHHDTSCNVGGEEIGRHVGAAYLYLDVEKPRRGHYRLTFRPIEPMRDDGEFPYTRSYMRMLEATIRREPACWLWSHRRWLYARPADEGKRA